jgi:hypothetical protein
MRENMLLLAFWVWLISLQMMISVPSIYLQMTKFHSSLWLSKIILYINNTFAPLLLCWLGVHCNFYMDFYNVSNIWYLNSPPLQFPFTSSSPDSSNNFNRYHFCIYILVCTFFVTHSPFYLLFLSPKGRTCSPLQSSNFCRWKSKKKNMTP